LILFAKAYVVRLVFMCGMVGVSGGGGLVEWKFIGGIGRNHWKDVGLDGRMIFK